VKLVPNEQIVEVVEFETADPALQGEMTITISLADANGDTDVVAVHDGTVRGRQRGWLAIVARKARGARRGGLRACAPDALVGA
jgi:hypothetical protein